MRRGLTDFPFYFATLCLAFCIFVLVVEMTALTARS